MGLELLIQGFKPITKPIKLEITDLTVITGDRGVGKSSVLEALQLLHLAKMRYPDVERSIEDFTPLSGKEKLNLEENEHLHLINTFTKYLSVCVIDRGEGRYFGIYMDRDRYLRPQLINSRNFRSEFKKILKDVKYDESEIEYILREGTLDKDVMPYTLILSALRSKVSSMSTHLEFNDIKDGKLDIHGSYIADLLTALITRVLDTEKDIWEEILKAFEEYYGTFKVSYVTFSGLRYDSKRNTPVFMESVFDRNAPIPYAMLSTGTRNIVSMVMTLAIAKVLLSRGYAERLIIGIEEPEITLSYTSVERLAKCMVNLIKGFITDEGGSRVKIVVTSHLTNGVIGKIFKVPAERYGIGFKVYRLERERDGSIGVNDVTKEIRPFIEGIIGKHSLNSAL